MSGTATDELERSRRQLAFKRAWFALMSSFLEAVEIELTKSNRDEHAVNAVGQPSSFSVFEMIRTEDNSKTTVVWENDSIIARRKHREPVHYRTKFENDALTFISISEAGAAAEIVNYAVEPL